MSLDTEIVEREEIGQHFKDLVDARKHDEAREFYHGLKPEVRQYIANHKQYKWCLKALQFSCL